jgi:ABC-type multidrug transport system fused ATPase/permease subunit
VTRTIRKALEFLEPRQRRAWYGLVALALLAALFEMIGTAAVFALIQLVSGPSDAVRLALPGLDWLAGVRSDRAVVGFSLFVALLYVFKNGLRLVEAYVRERCAGASIIAISTRLFGGYLCAPYSYHLRRNSAELIRNTEHAARVVARDVLQSAATAVSNALIALGVALVVIVSVPSVSLVAGLVIGLMMLGLFRVTQDRHRAWGDRVHHMLGVVLRTLQQSLGGVKEIKILGREDFFLRRFRRQRRELVRRDAWRRTLDALPKLVIETLFVSGVAILVAVLHSRADVELIPLLGMFAYAGIRILPNLQLVIVDLNHVRFATAPMDEVHRDWVELRDGVTSAPGAAERLPFRERIEVEGLSYRYEGSDELALDDVTFHIDRGESIGIVGATGAGKTTLIDLLLGLLPPTRGRISVDGRDIAEDPRSWQARIGYVPQSVYLVDDTIRRNVALGIPDAEIDEQGVWAAVRAARLDAFVDGLARGLDSEVGERGVRLSGGQRQRIAVARALYRKPDVLVFDEATAALDNQTERELTREIESLHHDETLIVIAHRLTTVRHCDRLLFLRDGRLADVGSYDALLARSPEFRMMVAAAEPPGAVAGL